MAALSTASGPVVAPAAAGRAGLAGGGVAAWVCAPAGAAPCDCTLDCMFGGGCRSGAVPPWGEPALLPGMVCPVAWPALAPARAAGVPPTGPCCGVVCVVCGCIELPAEPWARTRLGRSRPARAVIATRVWRKVMGRRGLLVGLRPRGLLPGPVQAAATPRN